MNHADQKIFLHPGEFCFAGQGTHVHTLLGSCISITLWHPLLRVGGMCHFVLPSRLAGATGQRPDGRYGDEAMELFDRGVRQRSTALSDYRAKVFGGGNMIGAKAGSNEDLVGTRNAETAIKLLMDRGVELAVADVGEFGYRRIVFDVTNGDVWVRRQYENASGSHSAHSVN